MRDWMDGKKKGKREEKETWGGLLSRFKSTPFSSEATFKLTSVPAVRSRVPLLEPIPNTKAALIQQWPCMLQQQPQSWNIFSLSLPWCCTPLWIKYPPNGMQSCSRTASTHLLIYTGIHIKAQGNHKVRNSIKMGRAKGLCFNSKPL